MAKLKITVGEKTFEREVPAAGIRAGRQPDMELPLPVREASREHLRIAPASDGGWAIQDLGSTNGTLLNGEPVKAARLSHEDRITVGPHCSIVFLDPPPPPEPKKPKGPIVLKSRADRLREQKEAEAQERAAARKAARGAKQKQPEVEPTETIEEAPADAVEIDSEATLVRLTADTDAFAELVRTNEVRFGPYTILGKLSEGGMGVVFKAMNRKQKLLVALKLLRTEMVDEQNIARFKQEAWAISAFDHKNIVKVRDLAERSGMHYIAMDYIHGDDLLAVGFKRTLTFWQTMEVIDKLADVLRLVHARNIWHRDIKPQNVLLDREGEVRLIDFGIATVEREQDDSTKTADGLIMGTPAFLSPEQAARGKMGAIDGRADLYSLGAVMYYLITGRRPFTGRSALEILKNNMTQPPLPPREVDPMVPAGLAKISLRLLEKKPADRVQSAGELQAELAKWRKSKDGRAEAERHKKIMKLRARKAKRPRE